MVDTIVNHMAAHLELKTDMTGTAIKSHPNFNQAATKASPTAQVPREDRDKGKHCGGKKVTGM